MDRYFIDGNMISRSVVLAIIVIIALSIGVYAANQYYAIFNIHGKVSVKYKTIDIYFEITSPEGTRAFHNIMGVNIEGDKYVLFKVINSQINGDVKIVVDGRAILKSSGREYTIDMPCMLVNNIPCIRVQTLIPGYDRPLKVEPGNYSVTLEISWKAEGSGDIWIKLAMLKIYRGSEAQIIPVGTKPNNATGWIVANSSTRTYAMLADKTSVKAEKDGYGYIRVWIWLFSPSSEDNTKVFKFQLIRRGCGCIVAELNLPVERHGFYYQVLLLIMARPGEYMFHARYPNGTTLRIPINVTE